MTEQELQRLGRRIIHRRRNHGLALRVLAAKAGVDYTWLHRLEQGAIAEPDPAKVTMVLDALELSGGRRLTTELAQRLPGMRTYFRTKYELTPEQVDRVARYVERLRRQP
jgi:transcriptional regulator with XRE-family HTH domain